MFLSYTNYIPQKLMYHSSKQIQIKKMFFNTNKSVSGCNNSLFQKKNFFLKLLANVQQIHPLNLDCPFYPLSQQQQK